MDPKVMKVLRPNFEKRGGLVTVVVVDVFGREVLMVAYTNEAGYLETLRTGNAVYFSTSRNKRWMKGEESGDVQRVKVMLIDCDGDAMVWCVEQKGGACHTKARSCFYRQVLDGETNIMDAPKAGEEERLSLIDAEVHGDLVQTTAFWLSN